MSRSEIVAVLAYLLRTLVSLVDRWPTTTWFLTAGWPIAVVVLVASGMRLW